MLVCTHMHACIHVYMHGVCVCVCVCAHAFVCVHARALRTVSTDKISALYKLLSLSLLQDVDKKMSLNLIWHVTYRPLPVPNHNQDCFWPNGRAGIIQLSFIHLMDVSFHLKEVFSSYSTWPTLLQVSVQLVGIMHKWKSFFLSFNPCFHSVTDLVFIQLQTHLMKEKCRYPTVQRKKILPQKCHDPCKLRTLVN